MDSKIKFRDEFCEKALNMALRGKNNAFMAKAFSVNPTTIGVWRHQYPQFDKAILLGKKARQLKIVHIVEALISEHDFGEV